MILLYIYIKVDNTITNFPIKGLILSKIDIVIDIIMSAIKIGSKIYKLTRYNKTIANPIYNY